MMMAFFRLTRPYYSIPLSGGLIVISFYLVGGDLSMIGGDLFFGVLSLYSILAAGYVLNDVCDIPVDAVNCPNRALPAGKLSQRGAVIGSIFLFITGGILGLFCRWQFSVVITLVGLGIILYDVFSKKMGLFKNVFVAFLTTCLYPLSFALAAPVFSARVKVLFIHPIWLFMTTLGYEMLKDILDTKGDNVISDARLSVCRNSMAFLVTARVIILIASLLTLLPYLLGYCRLIYLASSVVAIVMAILSAMKSPRKAIPFIYAEVFIITVGSLVDLLVYGV